MKEGVMFYKSAVETSGKRRGLILSGRFMFYKSAVESNNIQEGK
jgi:hypothetical protein